MPTSVSSLSFFVRSRKRLRNKIFSVMWRALSFANKPRLIFSASAFFLRLRAGALRRGGSLFEKSSAKTFFAGTAVECVIFGGEALLLRQSETQTGKRKRAFFCPSVSRTVGILIACDKNPPKMTWIAPRRAFFGGTKQRLSLVFRGMQAPLCKSFVQFHRKCAFHFKSNLPRPQAPPQIITTQSPPKEKWAP